MKKKSIKLTVTDVPLYLEVLLNDGSGAPLVCLHGFGSTKEEYADIASQPGFRDRSIVAYDAPGCGRSECANLTAVTIDFLRRTAEAVIEHYSVAPYHLIGHSMGGLTALKLAESNPGSVLSFTNIEGNLAPEDCFLSRQIIDNPEENDTLFLDRLIERIRNGSDTSRLRFAGSLRKNVRVGAVAPIFHSMVELSDNDRLLDTFLNLPMPKMFVYGEENRSLSYLSRLARADIRLAEIPRSGHFPMYANPSALWREVLAFIKDIEKERNDER